jgi:hypothetical protein
VESARRIGARDPMVVTRAGDAYDQLLHDPGGGGAL